MGWRWGGGGGMCQSWAWLVEEPLNTPPATTTPPPSRGLASALTRDLSCDLWCCHSTSWVYRAIAYSANPYQIPSPVTPAKRCRGRSKALREKALRNQIPPEVLLLLSIHTHTHTKIMFKQALRNVLITDL